MSRSTRSHHRMLDIAMALGSACLDAARAIVDALCCMSHDNQVTSLSIDPRIEWDS